MRILVVEDEVILAQRIKNILTKENYHVETVEDGEKGLKLALTEEYDLLILDILLPGRSGIDILIQVRNEKMKTPVLLLTVKSRIEDKVAGLDNGADDYLTKPFAIPELLARVRTLLRRTNDTTTCILKVADLELNTQTRQVLKGGKIINLTVKEFAILEYLLYNKNRVLSRLSIAEHVWGDNFDLFTMTNFVDVHTKNLRKKIGDNINKRLIQTVHGLGYTINDQV
jgi:DNA-binding response OmpR family regulator